VANNPTFHIRSASPEDLASILEIENLSFPGDRFSRRQFRYLATKAKTSFLILEEAGNVRAYSILFTPQNLRSARIYSIAVHPEATGRGYGRKMLETHLNLAREKGYQQVRLEVREDNSAAIALYEKSGFQQTGTKPDYYEDGATARTYKMILSDS